MVNKIFRIIFGLCIVAGFFVMFGAAGASDCGTVEFSTLMKLGGVELLLFAIGSIGLKLCGSECLD